MALIKFHGSYHWFLIREEKAKFAFSYLIFESDYFCSTFFLISFTYFKYWVKLFHREKWSQI